MEERIQALALRLEEIDALLASPEIAADAEKMRDLLRERKHRIPMTERRTMRFMRSIKRPQKSSRRQSF